MGSFGGMIKAVRGFAIEHSPEILTGIGIVGVVSTAVLAGQGAIKAERVLAESEATTEKDKAFLTWRYYIPAAMVGATTIACILGATSINCRRNAALGAAYSMSEVFAKEYREKVIERIGEKDERTIRDDILSKRAERKNLEDGTIIELSSSGDVLCHDSVSGRYFRSCMDHVREVQNRLNSDIMTGTQVTLNDFYYELGISGTKYGDMFSWSPSNIIEIDFGSTIVGDDPCICLDFINDPEYDPRTM